MKTWMQSKRACSESLEWISDRTPEQAWAECPRGDWMLWALGRTCVDNKVIVRIVCDIALSVLPLTDDPRADEAIQTALDWCDDRATLAEVRAAGDGAYQARRYDADADAAAYAAAASAASASAASAAYAAAAYAAAAYAAWRTARDEAGHEIANLIRTHMTPAEFAKLVKP